MNDRFSSWKLYQQDEFGFTQDDLEVGVCVCVCLCMFGEKVPGTFPKALTKAFYVPSVEFIYHALSGILSNHQFRCSHSHENGLIGFGIGAIYLTYQFEIQ